jgi:hypothetical protein
MNDGWLDSALATGTATGTYERLNDPSVNAMPAKLVGTAMTAALEPWPQGLFELFDLPL